MDLHWLPYPQRITYKLCMIMFKCLRGSALAYLADYCTIQHHTSYQQYNFAIHHIPTIQHHTSFQQYKIIHYQQYNINNIPTIQHHTSYQQCITTSYGQCTKQHHTPYTNNTTSYIIPTIQHHTSYQQYNIIHHTNNTTSYIIPTIQHHTSYLWRVVSFPSPDSVSVSSRSGFSRLDCPSPSPSGMTSPTSSMTSTSSRLFASLETFLWRCKPPVDIIIYQFVSVKKSK